MHQQGKPAWLGGVNYLLLVICILSASVDKMIALEVRKDSESLHNTYNPTLEEIKRGFVVTEMTGTESPRSCLKEIRIDVGRGEEELVPIEVFAIKPLKGLHLEVLGAAAKDELIRPETEEGYFLSPGACSDVDAGSYARTWLRVLPHNEAQDVVGQIAVVTADGRVELPLSLKVWPVDLPAERMMPTKAYAYCTTMGCLSFIEGNDSVRFPAYLDALRRIGCRTFELNLNVREFGGLSHVREKHTGIPIYEYLRKSDLPSISDLPDLDMSEWNQVCDEGLRDSAEDSAYYRMLLSLNGPENALSSIIGPGEKALLKVVELTPGEYAFDSIDPESTYNDFNNAKHRLLMRLTRMGCHP